MMMSLQCLPYIFYVGLVGSQNGVTVRALPCALRNVRTLCTVYTSTHTYEYVLHTYGTLNLCRSIVYAKKHG